MSITTTERRTFRWKLVGEPGVRMVWARKVKWTDGQVFMPGETVDPNLMPWRRARRLFWQGRIALMRAAA